MTGICARNFRLGRKDVQTKTRRPEGEEGAIAGRKYRGKGLDKYELISSCASFTRGLAESIYTPLSLFFPLLHPPPRVRPPAYTRVCRGEKVKKGKEVSRMFGHELIVHPVGEVL